MKEEQGDDKAVGSDDGKFSTAATGGDVHFIPRNKRVSKFSSSTTVDTPNESHQSLLGCMRSRELATKSTSCTMMERLLLLTIELIILLLRLYPMH